MVVQTKRAVPGALDLAYLSLFLGLRVNQLVMSGMAKAGFKGLRESHGYLIQHLIESERSITELARRMDVTQQAASKAVAELVNLGIVEASVAEDRRARRVRLSELGWQAVKLGRSSRKRLDKRIVRAVGPTNYSKAKATLLMCLEELGGVAAIRSRRIRAPR